ncbi:MAG: hypothetical protein KatS3mg126_1285 [Lysobacteraceae bacterium]|nr:MAG: hypothetical protein KatS3mg126_1285 [Xanthomonadaceae bacterium]
MSGPRASATAWAAGRWAAVLGAVQGAAGVALGAWAAHGAGAGQGLRLGLAALCLLLHAPLPIALAGRAGRWLGIARGGLLTGSWLFAGSLAAAALLGWSPALAPWGGSLLIAAWLLLAAAFLRGEGGQA